MTVPDPSPGTGASANRDAEIERLLEAVVDLPAAEHTAALRRLCEQHAELADDLRTRFDHYQRLLRCLPEPTVRLAITTFGEFELLRELGRGGMGVVYLARQQRAGQDRLIALKLVRDRGLLSDRARERLRREAAASFRLDDPGLCPVFDVGESDGVPWLAMRYVPGRTLADHIAGAQTSGALDLPPVTSAGSDDSQTSSTSGQAQHRHAAVLVAGEALARSLHTAHEAGFVHRDVKPGNVMITPDGLPVLLDFGLVREHGSDDSLTATGETLGTPAYMAPEQIDGRSPVDRTADVYSLAATLWEAIAFERPFAGRTREELFAAILQGDLRSLRKLAPGVSADLQLVLATAMAREPRHRFATTLEFAAELRRVRRSEPILTRPPGPMRRLALWSNRNRLAAVLVASLLLSLAVVVAVAVEARDAAAEARQARARAVDNLASARRVVAELVRVQNDELDDVPGLEGLRRDIQERALAFLREFRATSVGDAELAADHVESLLLGATLELSLGRPTAAAQLHEEAHAVLATLGDRPGVRMLRGQWHQFDGERKKMRGEIAAAIEAFELAAAELHAAAADDNRLRRMRALARICTLCERENDFEHALDAADRAVAERAELDDPARTAAVLEFSVVLTQRARLHREAARFDAAGSDYEAATAALRKVLTLEPTNRHVKALLTDCLESHAVLLQDLGAEERRFAAVNEALNLLEQLVAAFPSVPDYRSRLSGMLTIRAGRLHSEGRLGDAIIELERARGLLRTLIGERPENTNYRHRLAVLQYSLGNRLRRDHRRAAPHFLEALQELEHLLAIHPDEARWQELAARTAMNLGIVYAIADDRRAAETFARARRHTEHLLRLRPGDRRSSQLRGNLLFNEGTFRAEHDELSAALPILEQAFTQAVETLSLTPDNAGRAAEVLKWGVRFAQVSELHEPAGAEAAWVRVSERSQALPAQLLQVLDRDHASSLDLAMLRRGVAATSALGGDADGERRLAAALADLEQVNRADPSAAGRAEYLLCLGDLAAVARRRGDRPGAGRHRRTAAAHLLAWPADATIDNVTRRRLAARRASLYQLVGEQPEARAALDRLIDPQ